jgi:hypothetical protein
MLRRVPGAPALARQPTFGWVSEVKKAPAVVSRAARQSAFLAFCAAMRRVL